MTAKNKILIIGSEGFIGNKLIQYYLQINYEVFGCDLNAPILNNYHFIKNDMTSTFWLQLFENKKFDYCVNAGGKSDVNASVINPTEDFESHVIETQKILEAIRNYNNNCKFLHISSAAVYGNPDQLPVMESSDCKPLSPYGWHKLMSENICNEFNKVYNIPIIIIRPFSVYGPGLKKQIFWDVFQKYKKNPAEIELWGNGNETRDYIYIDDLISIIALLLINAEMKCDIYNIGSGIEKSIDDTIRTFLEVFGSIPRLIFNGNNKKGNPLNWKADISKIISMGYQNKYDFKKGISLTVDWLKSNG
jgi:dTDP-glucose 4,6-dehydratase/UDP-glucose 4-epimerase